MRLLFMQILLLVGGSLPGANNALAAATIYCEADDANVRFFLKAISHRLTAMVESYSLEVDRYGVSHSARNSSEAQAFGGLMYEGQDQLRIKSEFDDPVMLFEAYLANTGTDADGRIQWLGGYRVFVGGDAGQVPLRGAISCSDGY